MNNRLAGLVCLVTGMLLAGGALPARADEVAAIDEGVFRSIDLNHDGRISRREILYFTDLAFVSIDADGNDELGEAEFLVWDPGYSTLAEQRGLERQMTEVKRRLYAELDLNGDGIVEHDEFSVASLYDYYKADKDRDRSLSRGELLEQYNVLQEVRSVLK